MDKSGITLVALITTIIVLLILASIATYSGIEAVRSAKLTAFTTELKIMQTEVNNLYDEYKTKPTEIGKAITGEAQTQFSIAISSLEEDGISISSSNQANYRYFDQETIQSLGIEGVEEEFFVNTATRSIISYSGLDYENKIYYTLEQLPNGLYNVDYAKTENIPTFELSCENWVNGKTYITVSNIQYDGNIEKWEVKYQLKDQGYWNTSEDLTFIVETPGTYIVKIVNGTIESEEQEIEAVQANAPEIVEGMTQIMFKEPSGNTQGSTVKLGDTEFQNNMWYDYGNQKWANSMTEDGSMWVWIPRYAYKITYTDPNDKSKGGTIDVKFLIDDTDQYYDDSGNVQTAQRATSKDEIVDTTSDYYVHPAFTDETNLDYANGGWDDEITGIWVAKFEAGYASGNNDAEVKASSVNYSQNSSWVSWLESSTGEETLESARNWLDGIYGEEITAIKYPTFQGGTYSMNYINVNDTYNISRALTENGNIYGFNNSDIDSHLMKNSEWGAIIYLELCQYGLNGLESYVNNITLNNEPQSVYYITGVTTATTRTTSKTTTIEKINEISGNTANEDGVYIWKQTEGQKASSTGNMYGVFDLKGGMWEKIAAYIANGNSHLKNLGASMTYEGNTMKTKSTKYTTVYPHDSGQDNTNISSVDLNAIARANYLKNTKIFGDAIRETSKEGYRRNCVE